MIAPEDVQVGDWVAIFSSDGQVYRGSLFVREVFKGEDGVVQYIAFNRDLPTSSKQGDIICLIRRGDQFRQLKPYENQPDSDKATISLLKDINTAQAITIEQQARSLREWSAERTRLWMRADRAAQFEIALQQLRGMLVLDNSTAIYDIAQVYRDRHRYDEGCVDHRDNGHNDDRCDVCKQLDELLETVSKTSEAQPKVKRRIKSSSTK